MYIFTLLLVLALSFSIVSLRVALEIMEKQKVTKNKKTDFEIKKTELMIIKKDATGLKYKRELILINNK